MNRLASGLLVAAVALSAVPRPASADVKIDGPTRKAIGKALEYLAGQQNSDGSWSGGGKYPHNTAVTAFAMLALLSNGNLPGQGRYGPEVAKGARFLAASARPDGYLIGARGGNMYCHGMAALALAQVWGQTGDEEIKPVLTKAVDLIVRSQTREGGWRYEPRPSGHDISVTIMQVMALRAAKNSGIHVPATTINKAIEYINTCHDDRSGGYTYQPRNRQPGYARTAAGVCVLQLSGKYDAKEIERAVEFMDENKDENRHYWYGRYYASHAMHQVGGKKWEKWYTEMRDRLLAKQDSEGSWRGFGSDDGVGQTYTTAIAVIILSVPADYLPIFQN